MPPLILGAGSLAVMVLITSWIAHRIGVRIRRSSGRSPGSSKGDFQELPLGGQRDEVEDLSRSINHICVQLRDMQRHDPGDGAVPPARPVRRRAGPPAPERADGCPDERPTACPAISAPGGRPDLERRPAAVGDDRGAGQGPALPGPGREPAAEVCDLRQLLAEVALLVQPACQHAGVALQPPRGDRPLEVLADPSGVRAAVLNLTLNAIEAAGAGGYRSPRGD